MTHRATLVALLLTVGLVAFPRAAQAADAPSLDDHAALETWLDGTVSAQLEAYNVPGATVSIVKDGETILLKGYGYANVEDRTPVDPDTTLFRIASVSKLFTWLSVMQLVDQGKLDLNVDVNSYLSDIEVPSKYGQPITMKHLLTHTPGFEDQVIGLFAHDAARVRALADVLRDEMPARVREPGHIASYSNHGTGIAMHVVEQITGQEWKAYIQSNILDPLGMAHTVLAQPVPDKFTADLATGYVYAGQRFVPQGFEFVPLGPVGGLSTTAADAARFMRMFLQDGELDGARIIGETTAKTMQTDLHTMARNINPMDYGLIDSSRRGVRIIGHDGDTIYFHTMLALFPEHNTGVFISYNAPGGAQARGMFLDQFVKRYFAPGEPEKLTPPADFGDRAARYTGAYRVNRFSHKTFAKLSYTFTPANVTYDGDGALNVTTAGRRRWIEVAPNTFEDEDGVDRIVFIENDRGKVTHFGFADNPVVAFERIGPLATPALHARLFGLTLALCVIAVLAWPIAAIVRWRHGVIHSRHLTIPIAARAIGWVNALNVLAFAVAFTGAMEDPNEVAFGMPPTFATLLSIPLATTLLTAAMLLITVRLWTQHRGRLVWRCGYTLLTLAFAIAVWQAFYWNLTIIQNLKFL